MDILNRMAILDYLFHELCVNSLTIINPINIYSSLKLKYVDLKKKNMELIWNVH